MFDVPHTPIGYVWFQNFLCGPVAWHGLPMDEQAIHDDVQAICDVIAFKSAH